MLEIEKTKVYRIPERFVLHKLEDKRYWLFDIEEGAHFKLNFISYFILSCFDGKTNLFKIWEQLISKCAEIDTNAVWNDLEELVKKMVNKKVLEIIEER